MESTKEALALGQAAPGITEKLVGRILPLNLLGLAVGTVVFWRSSKRDHKQSAAEPAAVLAPEFRVNVFKAIIPVLPLILLFLTGPPLKMLKVPPGWLIEQKQQKLPPAVFAVGSVAPTAAFPGTVPWVALAPRRAAAFTGRAWPI